jgi:hypothetical protein
MKPENVRNPITHVYCIPNEPVHIAGFDGQDFGVLHFDVMAAA